MLIRDAIMKRLSSLCAIVNLIYQRLHKGMLIPIYQWLRELTGSHFLATLQCSVTRFHDCGRGRTSDRYSGEGFDAPSDLGREFTSQIANSKDRGSFHERVLPKSPRDRRHLRLSFYQTLKIYEIYHFDRLDLSKLKYSLDQVWVFPWKQI